MGSLFVECIIAPGFTPEAQEKLAKRKNCRLVRCAGARLCPNYEVRTVNQGLLWQTRDLRRSRRDTANGRWSPSASPPLEEWDALRFAWKACQHVKSNAIVLAQGEATVGIGGGQPNRVDCVRIAVERAGERTEDR